MLQPTSQSSILNDRQQLMMKEILSNYAYENEGKKMSQCKILNVFIRLIYLHECVIICQVLVSDL